MNELQAVYAGWIVAIDEDIAATIAAMAVPFEDRGNGWLSGSNDAGCGPG